MSGGNMDKVFKLMAERGASDVYLSAATPVQIKVSGQMLQLSDQPLSPEQPRLLISEVLSQKQIEELDATGELNVAVGVPGVGRFRLSAFRQRGSIAAVFRFIPFTIPTLASLQLPPLMNTLALQKRGLILVVGSTGAGKSTTLAAMLEQRNQDLTGHILTIEDPIEFLFRNKQSVVNQREVGRDTESLQVGLRNALRQAPDCILIGEIRDRETMSAALSYSLSGHLVLSTLHANNSHHALSRILSFYPPEARPTMLADLAAGLRAVVSQRLLRGTQGGRVPAVEVLQNTQLISDLIESGDIGGVREAMEQSMAEGSQTFEQDLARLVSQGMVSQEEALAYADSPTNLMWRMQNDSAPKSKKPAPKKEEPQEGPVFTETTVDVIPVAPPKGMTAFPPLQPLNKR
jgi:twitching motility protein PilU